MTKIDDQIKQLKEKEKQLALEKLKIEFLDHILVSSQDYSDEYFDEVKDSVLDMLEDFVGKAINSIENGSILTIDSSTYHNSTDIKTQSTLKETEISIKKDTAVEGPNLNDKLSFALEHRQLGGKRVSVINDKDLEILGEVVGLDAPWVNVKTEEGPVIKVPVEKIKLERN